MPRIQTLLEWTVLIALVVAGFLVAWNAELPANAAPFTPPAVYARWWAMTEACSGRSGNLADLQWYRVPVSEFMYGGQRAGGYTSRWSNRIVLIQAIIERGEMVRHEMLHALLRRGGHPRAQFLGSCASIVLCQGYCIKAAGPWHPPRTDYVVLPPDSLEVASHAQLLPRESDGQRWFDLEITVRNPRGRAVVVAAPGDRVTPGTFGYPLRGPVTSWSPFRGGGIGGREVMTDSSTVFFQPFETKKWLFEFLVADTLDQHHISPGMYVVRGDYARHQAANDTVAVSP
jgi:hypothetical protein